MTGLSASGLCEDRAWKQLNRGADTAQGGWREDKENPRRSQGEVWALSSVQHYPQALPRSAVTSPCSSFLCDRATSCLMPAHTGGLGCLWVH